MITLKRRLSARAIVAFIVGVLPTAVHAEPTVVLISGTGYQPTSLARGKKVSANTIVTADRNTIIVLADSWRVGNNSNHSCKEYVVIRDEDYRVPSVTPNDCSETGQGNELGKAMAGNKTMARIRALQISDAKADMPDPDNFRELYSDLRTLDEQVREEQKYPRSEATMPVTPGRVGPVKDPAEVNEAQRQRDLVNKRREKMAQESARREREAQKEAAERKAANPDPAKQCLGLMRRSLAASEAGSSWWDPEKAKRLCAGTRAGDQPLRCFNAVTKGRIPTGNNSRWTRDHALELCQGTSDAERTVGCYRKLSEGGVAHKLAMEACSGGK